MSTVKVIGRNVCLLVKNKMNEKEVVIHSRQLDESIYCGEIRYAYLPKMPEVEGHKFHIQEKARPVLIVSNNANNRAANGNVQVIPFTSKDKTSLPTHLSFKSGEYGLQEDSILMAECETQIPSMFVFEKIGQIDDKNVIEDIVRTIIIQHGLFAKLMKKRYNRSDVNRTVDYRVIEGRKRNNDDIKRNIG